MQSQSHPLDQLKCHITDTDRIPAEEFYNNPNSFEGELYLFCERKHVLSFLKNPGNHPPEPSDVSQYYSSLPANYPNFFKNSNDVVFEQFTNIINLRQLEYWSGTSFAIRLFLESLIYANYGTYAWYGNTKLRSKTDKVKIEDVYHRIGKLGFDVFMTIVISRKWKRNLIDQNLAVCQNNYGLSGDRLIYATEAANNLKDVTINTHWIDSDVLKKAQKVFGTLSPLVHSREIVDPSAIDNGLDDVLSAYEEFYSNGNEWRIIYEQ